VVGNGFQTRDGSPDSILGDTGNPAEDFGVNAVMYALCLDYKTEQAHIDYILRTRRFPR